MHAGFPPSWRGDNCLWSPSVSMTRWVLSYVISSSVPGVYFASVTRWHIREIGRYWLVLVWWDYLSSPRISPTLSPIDSLLFEVPSFLHLLSTGSFDLEFWFYLICMHTPFWVKKFWESINYFYFVKTSFCPLTLTFYLKCFSLGPSFFLNRPGCRLGEVGPRLRSRGISYHRFPHLTFI